MTKVWCLSCMGWRSNHCVYSNMRGCLACECLAIVDSAEVQTNCSVVNRDTGSLMSYIFLGH